jgi:hypothetical protein
VKKPVLLVLHPKDWAEKPYGKTSGLDIHHVSIGGKVPKKLSGTPTYDGYAEAVTEEGIESLYSAAKKLQPDFFLFWLHAGLYEPHIAKVKELAPNVRCCFWFGNHRTQLAGNVTNIRRHINLLLLNSTEPTQFKMYHDYGIKNVATLWDGFDPEFPLVDVKPEFDCFFAGESYVEAARKNHALNFPGTQIRRQFVLRAEKEFKLAVHSARKDSWPFKTLPEVYHPHHISAMRKAKLTLNVNHFPSFRQAYTRRTIRSLFSGRPHITLYIPGMEEHFENGKDVLWFETMDEGLELIRYYLSHDDERELLATRQLEKARRLFSFEERLKGFEKDLRRFFPEKFK